jgi:predicted N-acyltransferase
MALSWQPILSVDDITQQQWHQLTDHDEAYSTPFLSYVFLKGLEKAECVNGETGWHSYHIGIYEHSEKSQKGIEGDVGKQDVIEASDSIKTLIGFIPCYLKTHSYGEYIFDHAWANAYQHHQIPYYPKLVACIPFTPVTGSRLLVNNKCDYSFEQITAFILASTDNILEQARASSFHYLFLPEYQSKQFAADKLLQRLSVQFVWHNRGYNTFDDFMQQMTSRKRRSIRKERTAAVTISETDTIIIKRLTGDMLTKEVLDDFYLCYQQTYLKRSGHNGYLTGEFFDYLQSHMQDNIMIVMAYHAEKCIASALFFYNDQQLFGRYWGALQEVSGLHFECCYYQGIDFAIEKQLRQFNPGTQGEHKILRGFEPTFCYSNHYLQQPDFQTAVRDFLQRERIGIQQYKQQSESVLPFKQA